MSGLTTEFPITSHESRDERTHKLVFILFYGMKIISRVEKCVFWVSCLQHNLEFETGTDCIKSMSGLSFRTEHHLCKASWWIKLILMTVLQTVWWSARFINIFISVSKGEVARHGYTALSLLWVIINLNTCNSVHVHKYKGNGRTEKLTKATVVQ